jgi:hypothetical protein
LVLEGEVTEQRAGKRLNLFDHGLGQGGSTAQCGSDHIGNAAEVTQRRRDQL